MITVVAPSLGLYTSPLWIFLLYFAIMNLSSVLRSEFFFYTSPLGIVVYCTSLCCLWPWPHYSSTLYCPLYSLFVSVFNPLGRSFHVKRITYEGVDVSSRFTKPGLWEILGTLNPKVWGKNEFGVFFPWHISPIYFFIRIFFYNIDCHHFSKLAPWYRKQPVKYLSLVLPGKQRAGNKLTAKQENLPTECFGDPNLPSFSTVICSRERVLSNWGN